MNMKLSVVISAYNEEMKIGKCLDSVSNIADEIIVVDNSSQDKTADIAKSHKARVFKRENLLMLNINKNFGFEKATGEWILNLDADEEVTPELAKEIRDILDNPSGGGNIGYWISRKNIIFGKWIQHGLWWPDRQLRLFKRGHGKFVCKHIHEYVSVDGEIGELVHPYIHYNYDTIDQYLTKLERCTRSESIALKESQYQWSWFDAFRFPLSDFIKIYFAQQGYKDGLHGIVLALFQAFYSFVVFAKLWEMEKFQQMELPLGSISHEMTKNGKELSYWMRTSQMKESNRIFEKIVLKIKRHASL